MHVPPVVIDVGGVNLRSIAIPEDLAPWLAMRERAVAELTPPVRNWKQRDFRAEMSTRPWWSAERSWVAVSPAAGEAIVGAVTLAIREGAAARAAVVHWLLVDPAWRRRGVGRVLMSHLERAAWDDGWREVQLETHAGWSAAVAFYQSIGYALLRPAVR